MRSAAKSAGEIRTAVRPAQQDRNAPASIDHRARTLAFDLHAQGVLHVLDRQTVAAGGQPVDHDAQVLHAVVLDRVDVLVAGHLFHQLLNLAGQIVERLRGQDRKP
jgi:saccharopine dehydrogenase-like NADP-dependent oxidoreductase